MNYSKYNLSPFARRASRLKNYNGPGYFVKIDPVLTVTKLEKIIDNQTFLVNAFIVENTVYKGIEITLRGVTVPQLEGECDSEKKAASELREFLVEQFKQAKQVLIYDLATDDNSRLYGELNINNNELSKMLLNKELAISSAPPKSWCDLTSNKPS